MIVRAKIRQIPYNNRIKRDETPQVYKHCCKSYTVKLYSKLYEYTISILHETVNKRLYSKWFIYKTKLL